jgi:hypothetical protein
VVLLTALAGCGSPREPTNAAVEAVPVASVKAPPKESAVPAGPAEVQADAAVDAGSAAESAQPAPDSPCPEGMAYVDTTYCPEPELECLDKEHNKANHIVICHKFAVKPQGCKSTLRRQRFCIDRYEYPNREGGHPPVMVDWYDAAEMCAQESKRLCWESEWVAACEGPEKKPFPYGYDRDPKQCNIDNMWLNVSLDKIYSPDPAVQDAELFRLDQSVSSGEMPGCVSGFGVHDQTGNVDEWVNAEQEYEKSRWAGLKGGAWGHVRNACRPMTTSHPPEWSYYFVSFRCCADAAPDPEAEKDPKLWKPPQQHDHKKLRPFKKGWTPKGRGPNQPVVKKP